MKKPKKKRYKNRLSRTRGKKKNLKIAIKIEKRIKSYYVHRQYTRIKYGNRSH